MYLQNASTTGINHAIIRSKFEKRTALGSRASFSEENMTKRSSIAPIGEEKPSTGKNIYCDFCDFDFLKKIVFFFD